MIITKAQKEDLQEILDLQYLAYESEAKLLNNTKIPPLTQTLSQVNEEYNKGIILKAVNENNVIIGSVRAYCEKGTAYIGKLMVSPKFQGKGIGTKLLLEIENSFPKCRYELFTSTKSMDNIKLYQRFGYKVFKEKDIAPTLRFVYLEKIKD